MDWIRFHIAFFFLVLFFSNANSNELGSSCSKDRHCKVDNSYCFSGVCTCKHYHAQLGNTKCLESKLLGRDCIINEQCSLRVANSVCFDGHCHCSQGYLRFRKHTCLGPAKPGDVCYSDEHCRLWSKNSHCNFLIPKLFGKCICDGEGNCEANEEIKPATANTTTVGTNQTNSAEITTISTIEGETSQDTNENESEENNNSQETFVDPSLTQKENHKEVSTQIISTENLMETEGTTVSNADDIRLEDEMADETQSLTTLDEFLETETTTVTKLEASTEGSKYRVESREKETSENINWSEVKSVSLGYPCQSDIECRKRDKNSRCLDGFCDCVFKTNSTNSCSKENTGCGPETFQCRESGQCVSWFFVCDGRSDCADNSDEECKGPKCPKTSFQCSSTGPCLSQAVICDGIKNCPNGEDEYFCKQNHRNSTQGCPENTFQCANGQCLPKYEFCNAIPKCSDGSDESPHLCSSQILGKKVTNRKNKEYCPFECGNKRCRSTAIVCSGRDGCGDNSDEAYCTVCSCPSRSAVH